MRYIVVTFCVSNVPRLRVLSLEQPLNIDDMLVTFEVLR